MPSNSLEYTSSVEAWDVASNWSLGRVPQATDNVDITNTTSNLLGLVIGASDPAYTIASLTENSAAPSDGSTNLDVSGSLTVLGPTTLSTGSLTAEGNGRVALGSVALSGNAVLSVNAGGSASLSVTSLSVSGITSSVVVFGGSATIGTIAGAVSLSESGATVTVGTPSGTGTFNMTDARLNLQSVASSLADTIKFQTSTVQVDLEAFALQAGEYATTAVTNPGYFANITVTLRSSTGQALYTFQHVSSAASSGVQVAPTVTLTSDGAGGTLVTLATPACFLAGTRIAVPGGERLVETLVEGDLVLTASGQARPIRWVGHRSYGGRFLRANAGIQPVRFRAGSLGAGLPRRDLLVSPEHAMFIDGRLVPARLLVNGSTVVAERGFERVDYLHLELDSHDVLLAEGALSESFVDDDSRGMFHNAAEWARLHPGEAPMPAMFCAPRIEVGPALEAIRRRLAGITGQAGQAA